MVINSAPRRGDGDWPWSALGILQTSDKDAIHAAYAAKRADLDAQAMRISAFAELTEAREKALFLASEILREETRKGPEKSDNPVDGSASGQGLPAEPEPEPEPEPVPEPEPEPEDYAGPWERGGRYASEQDIVDSFNLDDQLGLGTSEETFEYPDYDEPIDDSRYIPATQKPVSDEDRQSDTIVGFAERYQLRKNWFWWAIGIVALTSYCSSGGDEDSDPITRPPYQAIGPDTGQPAGVPALPAIAPAQANAMVEALFGPQFTYPDLLEADPRLAAELVERIGTDPEDFSSARAHLRTQILRARAVAPREQAFSIAELHLAWLQTAQSSGSDACREVTSELFFEGAPEMRDDWVGFEKSVAAQLLASGAYATVIDSDGARLNAIPQWAFADAAANSALGQADMRAALRSYAHPDRCETEISLIKAMLARPGDTTSAMLAAI